MSDCSTIVAALMHHFALSSKLSLVIAANYAPGKVAIADSIVDELRLRNFVAV